MYQDDYLITSGIKQVGLSDLEIKSLIMPDVIMAKIQKRGSVCLRHVWVKSVHRAFHSTSHFVYNVGVIGLGLLVLI